METFAIFAAALAATTAFLIGARRIVGEFATAARRQDRIDQALVVVDRLLHRELTDTGNGSLKSQVTRVSAQIDQTQSDVAHVQDTIDEHLEDPDLHNRAPHAHRPDN